MDPNEAVKSEATPDRIATAGERWQRQTAVLKRRNASARRWLGTGRKILAERRAVATKFATIEKRVQAERPSADPSPDQIQDHLADITGRTAAEAESEDAGLRPDLERSSHFMLDARLKNLLAGMLDIRIPAVKIYTNQQSDEAAKQQNADAVTYQDKVFFRANKFKPADPAGMALLGHELTHVAQERMDNQQTKGLAESHLAAQEREALANEVRILHQASEPANRPGSYSPAERLINDRPGPQIHSALPDGRRGRSFFSEPPVPAFGPDLQGRARSGPAALKVANPKALPALEPGVGGRGNTRTPIQQARAASSSRQISLPPEPPAAASETAVLSDQQLNHIKEAVYQDLMDRIRTEFERGG